MPKMCSNRRVTAMRTSVVDGFNQWSTTFQMGGEYDGGGGGRSGRGLHRF